MTVIFDTPGILDLRAITTFGLNAKPEAGGHPIGYFGTGLKYALAVLAREEQEVHIFAGENHYQLGVEQSEFRGKGFQAITLLVNGTTTLELPFTTELGKNWQLWMAYRELYSNTLDEMGTSIHTGQAPASFADPERTIIAVSGEAFDAIWTERRHIFLENAQRYGNGIEVLQEPSTFVFYRGIRAGQLSYPSLFTYNFLDSMELTEDRNFANMWMVQYYISNLVTQSTKRDFVELALGAGQAFFEGHINFESSNQEPSQVFKDVCSERTARARPIPSSARALLKKFQPTPEQPAWLVELKNHTSRRDLAGINRIISADWARFENMLRHYGRSIKAGEDLYS